ncbi:hypothetical protein ACKKBG_A02655 [Auxenochlorella protothecoides x Auxenochlorella symbiontica]
MKKTSALLLLTMLVAAFAIAAADDGFERSSPLQSSREEYRSGYRPNDWQRYYWCERYRGFRSYCYYWWWYNGHYYYNFCPGGRCSRGERRRPFH